jgi:cephalosporin hydroxylase
MFDDLVWLPDRMLLSDLVFRLEHYRSDAWDGGDHFRFYKTRELVHQYQAFFARYTGLRASRVLELGIYDGGSTAFWNELLQPDRLIAVDILGRSDSPYFEQYLDSRGLNERVRTFWQTNQADKQGLRSLVAEELGGRVDLVIDDASHLYGPTRASFEAVFPLCSPGAIYIIEDWAWDHWGGGFSSPDHPWAHEERLTQLVIELIEAAGTSTKLISSIAIYQGFVAIERGPQQVENYVDFCLEDYIVRRPARSEPRHSLGLMDRAWGRLRRSLPQLSS